MKGSLPGTIHHLRKGRSSFFALNRYGSRFGCLHPLSALKPYLTFSLPRLLYGAELWDLTKVELNMFERMHRKILRTIQGLRTRCPISATLLLLGVPSVKYMVIKKRLLLLHSVLRLPRQYLCKKTFLSRLSSHTSNPKSWISATNQILRELLLPSCQVLRASTMSLQAVPGRQPSRMLLLFEHSRISRMMLMKSQHYPCSTSPISLLLNLLLYGASLLTPISSI